MSRPVLSFPWEEAFVKSATRVGLEWLQNIQTGSTQPIDLQTDVTGRLQLMNFIQASAADRLLGRGSSGGPGNFQEISLGPGLSMVGTTLDVTPVTATQDATILAWLGL